MELLKLSVDEALSYCHMLSSQDDYEEQSCFYFLLFLEKSLHLSSTINHQLMQLRVTIDTNIIVSINDRVRLNGRHSVGFGEFW